MREDRYRHTQFAWATLAILLGAMAVVASFSGAMTGGHVTLVVFGAMLLIAVLFGSLTVTVDEERITCRFGPGPIRKRFLVADVVSVEPARNAWWWGWGIRLTPRGWLFNVSGLDAVELTMKNGNRYRIGTNQPEELAVVIRRVAKLPV